MSTPDECKTKGFSQTACGFVVEFTDVITKHIMNSTSTNVGGWVNSNLYSFINDENDNSSLINALPSDLKEVVVDTQNITSHGKSDSNNFTSTDKLYLLTPKELYSDWSNQYDSAKDFTRQLDYYGNNDVTTDNYSGAIKTYNGSASIWWLDMAASLNSLYFAAVNINGKTNVFDADGTFGVSPAFRIE